MVIVAQKVESACTGALVQFQSPLQTPSGPDENLTVGMSNINFFPNTQYADIVQHLIYNSNIN